MQILKELFRQKTLYFKQNRLIFDKSEVRVESEKKEKTPEKTYDENKLKEQSVALRIAGDLAVAEGKALNLVMERKKIKMEDAKEVQGMLRELGRLVDGVKFAISTKIDGQTNAVQKWADALEIKAFLIKKLNLQIKEICGFYGVSPADINSKIADEEAKKTLALTKDPKKMTMVELTTSIDLINHLPRTIMPLTGDSETDIRLKILTAELESRPEYKRIAPVKKADEPRQLIPWSDR